MKELYVKFIDKYTPCWDEEVHSVELINPNEKSKLVVFQNRKKLHV